MIKRATLVWMALSILSGIGLFNLKYSVSEMEDRLIALQKENHRQMESIHVLKAEWSYLNQPFRINDLGQRKLLLTPVTGSQAIDIKNIPFRPEFAPVYKLHSSVPPAVGHNSSPIITSKRVP